MDTLLLLIYLIFVRSAMLFFSKKASNVVETYVLAVFLITTAFAIPLPIFLIKKVLWMIVS